MTPPPPTYLLGHDSAGRATILCRLCGLVSALPGDIANRYCGRCHLFHDAVALARQMHANGATHECHEWRTWHEACAVCGRLARRKVMTC